MSWKHIEDTEPRGRKQYTCDLCGLRIRKGAKHVRRVGVSFGRLYTGRYHAVCEAATHDWDEYEFECHNTGSFQRYELRLPLLAEGEA